jgi:hypothetical protein
VKRKFGAIASFDAALYSNKVAVGFEPASFMLTILSRRNDKY